MATKKKSRKKGVTLSMGKLIMVKQTKKGKKADAKKDAMAPGKRRSKTGKVYYEGRSNRAD